MINIEIKLLSSYKKINKCRICNSSDLYEYLNLGNQPLANSFIKENDIKFEKNFPLKINLCRNCGLSLLSITINPNIIFKSYDYLSSSSRALVNHYKELTIKLCKNFNISKKELILDIGCNDGVLLNQYSGKFKNLLGIEPSSASKLIDKKKIKLVNDFFNYNLSIKIKKKYGFPKLITITNVFAHIDNINNFVRGLSNISNLETVIIIEFPYLIDMIEKNCYDLIYHEHLSYLSLTPLVKLFKDFDMKIFDVEKLNLGASGPALRVYISKVNSINIQKRIVKKYLNYEKQWGVKKIKSYKTFNNKVFKNKKKLENLINGLIIKGNLLGCFSAPAKGNTLLNFIKLNSNIKFVSENNIRKLGKYTPGTHLKIISDEDFVNKKIDYAILLSWNYVDYFVKNSLFSKRAKGFIIPMPIPKIISFEND